MLREEEGELQRHLFSSLRRFPEIKQSVRETGKVLISDNRASRDTFFERPKTANLYEKRNKKYVEPFNHKKIYDITYGMKSLARNTVTADLNQILYTRRHISANRKREAEVLTEEFSQFMLSRMNAFEVTCVKLHRAGFLDRQAIKYAHTGKLPDEIMQKFLALLCSNTNLTDSRRGIPSIEILQCILDERGVHLSHEELKTLFLEIAHSS